MYFYPGGVGVIYGSDSKNGATTPSGDSDPTAHAHVETRAAPELRPG